MDGGNVGAPEAVGTGDPGVGGGGRGDRGAMLGAEFILFLMFSPHRMKNLRKKRQSNSDFFCIKSSKELLSP